MLEEIIRKWGGHEVSAMQVYTDLFGLGEGLIQRQDEEPGAFKSNPLGYWKNDGEQRGHRRILFDDTFEETLKEMQEADFSILGIKCVVIPQHSIPEIAAASKCLIFLSRILF